MTIALTWEIFALDVEFQSAMIEKEIRFLKRRKASLAIAWRIARERIAEGAGFPV